MAVKKSKHHFIPRSRGGSNGPNTKIINHDLHMSWHHLFWNLLPWEVVEKLATGTFRRDQLSEARRMAWDLVFDGRSEQEAVGVVLAEWFPPYPYLKEFLEVHKEHIRLCRKAIRRGRGKHPRPFLEEIAEILYTQWDIGGVAERLKAASC